MTRFLPFVFLFAGLCLFSCSKSTDDNPNISFSLENELLIVLWEDLTPAQREFALRFSTIEDQDCEDTGMAYSYKQENKIITLSINDLLPPDDCIDHPEPAQTVISLGELLPDVYNIQINLKEEIINKGKLSIYTDRYEISMETLHGIDFKNKSLFRIPDHTYWGYVSYNASTVNHAERFIDDLAVISDNRSYSQGDYGHFIINQQNAIELTIDSNLPQYQTVIFHNDDLNALEELLQEYRTSVNQDFDIKIFSYQGVQL